MILVSFSAPENIITLRSLSLTFHGCIRNLTQMHPAHSPVRHQGLDIQKGMEKRISPCTGTGFCLLWAWQYGGKSKKVKK